LLTWAGVKVRVVDFHRPTDANGGHPRLFDWVRDYVAAGVDGEKAFPVYLQHQGHSRTAVGWENTPRGHRLLVLDPKFSAGGLRGTPAEARRALSFARKTLNEMKMRQFQIVAVVGLFASGRESQNHKVVRSLRIP